MVDEILYLKHQVEYFKAELDKSQARVDELQRLLFRETGVIKDIEGGKEKLYTPVRSMAKSWPELKEELEKRDRLKFLELSKSKVILENANESSWLRIL